MSHDPTVEDTRRKLDDLEQRIQAARSSPGAHAEFAEETQRDWDEMLRMHADIRRKLDAAEGRPTDVLEGIRFDIDVLRHSFERWASRVEGNYAHDLARKQSG
jgi:hypothetical protein